MTCGNEFGIRHVGSLYVALPRCFATAVAGLDVEAMVIDEQVDPLLRIWCLFEVYHTILLSQNDDFEGGRK